MGGLGVALLDSIKATLRSAVSYLPPAVYTPRVTVYGDRGDWLASLGVESVSTASVSQLFRTQPHLQAVVSFIARNIAQLGLHVYERVNDTDRRRDRTSPVARTLSQVDGRMTTYELIYALVGDLMLYDTGYWFVGQSADLASGWMLRRLPPSWVTPLESTAFEVTTYRVALGGEQFVDVPASQMLVFPGYGPASTLRGSSAVESLRSTLQEQVEAAAYRAQVWKRGGRVSAVIERPAGADWSDAARKQFREDWYSKFSGDGPGAGGTPILEDGMKLSRVDFSAKEQEFVEAAKLSLITVAAAYHVNPTMIGLNDGANYSNVREFRKMLYGDTLGPTLARIESRINTFLIPMLGLDPDRFYVEFNIAEKLQGNFEEQTQAMQAAIGRAWMTPDEGRARLNMPALGGDAAELSTPLNVTVGGQASPQDSAPKTAQPATKAAPVRVKAKPRDGHADAVAEVLRKHFARQRRIILTALGVKASEADWWDGERWDEELSADLYELAMTVTGEVSADVLDGLGLDPDRYDPDRTVNFLRKVAETRAGMINEVTRKQIEAALAEAEPDVPHVFDVAESARADQGGVTLATTLAAFAAVEAVKQINRKATKTWVVNGSNPRPEHADMDGETVPVGETFSNGAKYPGDWVLGVDGVAGCTCTCEMEV